MVQYIPGPEALLAPAAQQLTEGILDFINPNRKFQQAVQASIAQNPQIAQHFANLEASSPGLLKQLGIGALGQIPATPDAQFAITQREGILKGKEAQLGAETAKDLYSGESINRALELVKSKPELGFDAALKVITGQTATERATDETKLELGKVQLAGAQSGLPAQMAEDQFKMETLGAAQEILQAGPEVTYQKFMRNEYTPKQLLGIFGTPLGDAIKQQLNFMNDQLRIQLMSGRSDDAFERLKYGRAVDLFMRLKDPNLSIDDIHRYMNRGPGEIADPDDPTAKAIQAGLSRLQLGDINDVLSTNRRDLSSLLTRFQTSLNSKESKGEKGDANRALIVAEIDQVLENNSKLPGAQRYTASYETVPRGSFLGKNPEGQRGLLPRTDIKELVFRGPDGKVVTADKALLAAPTSAPQTSSTVEDKNTMGSLSQNMLTDFKRTYDQLPTTGEKQAQLARWKAEAPPEAWQQLAKFLGVKP